jgi:CheY-like chemotaxis protein
VSQPCPDLRTPGPTPRRARLLIVDDEPGILRVLQRILGRHHDVFIEFRAETALQRILSGERFDLILSDVMMPGMTGIKLLDELTRVAPGQARGLVFLTGGASTPTVRQFLAATTHHMIEKPFDAGEILAFVADRISRDDLVSP